MATDPNEHLILTDHNFTAEVLHNPKPVLVDFWAPWCGPCRLMNPIIADLAARYDGRIRVEKVNVDEQPSVSSRYEIRSIPTLLLFNDAQVVERIVGLVPKGFLVKKIEELLRIA